MATIITVTDGKTITERYGDDRRDSPIKTRMQEIEEQTGISIDRDLIIDRSQQSKNQQEDSANALNP